MYTETFNSSAEMFQYINCKNLFIPALKTEESSILTVTGKSNGQIESITTEVDYCNEFYTMQTFSTIYTEHYTDELITGTYTADYEHYEESVYQNMNGVNWKVLTIHENTNNSLFIEGYCVIKNVLYNVYMVYLENNKDAAIKQFYEYLDLYK